MVLHAMNDDRLGPYRLLRRLGEGGMGVVHLAVDPQGRQVAVKVLRGEVAGDEVARRRLSREVETMRRVRSSYIAEVVDADVTGHRPYIVTRYVPGRPLDEIVKDDGPLDLPALVRVAHGVASALAAVHSVGVIHRDLKPGNVLILDGDPVLIDFGIAQAVDATRLTQTGMFIGTPGYLAPEIIEGQEAGPEVDVHAWAGTLLYAATGQPPFGKGTLEMIFYNITAGKADVSAAPAELQPMLKAAFQRNPAKRPKAADLAEQTARMLPRPARGAVPDEISTVPRSEPHGLLAPPPYASDKPSYDVSTPPMTPRSLIDAQQGAMPPAASAPPAPSIPSTPPVPPVPPVSTAAPAQQQVPPAQPAVSQEQPQYVSLLPGEADPWPTRRVTPEELAQVNSVPPNRPWPQAGPGSSAPHSAPHSALPGAPSVPQSAPHGAPQGFPGVPQGTPYGAPQGLHGAAHAVPQGAAPVPASSETDMPTRRVRPESPDFPRPNPVPPPYIPAQPQFPPDPVTRGEPFIPAAVPGQPLRQSKAYAVASAMLAVIMIVAAVLAPVVTAVVVLPLAVLLRAAEMAQPSLISRRPSGAAALDVVRVLALPKELVKSVGITLALSLYALVLGTPVTLILTVFAGMDPSNALAWGAAVALWTVCAGPAVVAPGRQMRRTLSSLVPSRTAAMVMAGVLAVGAALSLILAYSTFGDDPRGAVWTPLNVTPVTGKLEELGGG